VDEMCSICHSRSREFKCRRCRSPVCDECAFKIDLGAFCSRKCANQFRDFHRARARAEQGNRISVARFILLLVIVGTIAVLVAWWRGWLPRSWTTRLQKEAGTVQEELQGEVKELKNRSRELLEKTPDPNS